MAKKKVAIVLSGGVSLGSYIAGALDELMKAFGQAKGEYEIDIITGASAGATTAALIAHGLRYNEGDTALYDVWVNKVDMADLLTQNVPADGPPTLLDGTRLNTIAQETLQWKDPNNKGKRAQFCAENLTVSMTLGNTTALPYASRVSMPAAGREELFVQYRNAEQETFYLNKDLLPTDPLWGRIGDVARASSAIPFVFPLVPLSRSVGDLLDDRQYIQKPRFEGERRFWYYDGGTFNNLPLDLAAYHMSKHVEAEDERAVVVVNPWRQDIGTINQDPPLPNLIERALGLYNALQGESSALQFNHEVIIPSVRQSPPVLPPGVISKSIPGVPPAPVELLGKFALVMPKGGDARLRGNHLSALAAFLDWRFREYDFRRGAADAQRVARDVLKINYDAGRPAGYYDPEKDANLKVDIESYSSLDRIMSTRDPARSILRVFEDGLDRRIDTLIDRLDLPKVGGLLESTLHNTVLKPLAKHIAHEQLPGAWTH